MVEVVFLGVGEAFDERNPNTSILIKIDVHGIKTAMLLDCGFSAVPQVWKESDDPEEINCVWISHFHGDHFMGVPPLLVRYWEEGRNSPLTIMGQKGLRDKINKALEIAYPGFSRKISFTLEFIEVEPGEEIRFMDCNIRTAENDHSKRDLAIRIDSGDISIFYSGDGRPTDESRNLAEKSKLIIHEAFRFEEEIPGHGTVLGSMSMARDTGSERLALVHIQRKERDAIKEKLRYISQIRGAYQLFIPDNMDRLFL